MEAMLRAFGHHNKRVCAASRLRAVMLLAGLALAAVAASAQAPSGAPRKTASQPPYNPYQATKEVEVGKFYLTKGKYDAAIVRFQNAVNDNPGWAVPHLYLGEAYEKRGNPKRAVAEYQTYLKITPYAKDAKKISKRIDKLSEEIKRQGARAGGS
jgi:tetratricopeptide (TPR) repeat protein